MFVNPSAPLRPHVLVVGIDGVRYDALMAADTPFLDGLASTGTLLPVRVHDKNATISGPVWSTVATGVYADRHLVTGNHHHPEELDGLPDFTARLRSAWPELETMIAASWYPLARGIACGPVFSSQGWVPVPDPEEANDAGSWLVADDAVAAYAAQRLASEDLAVSFVYFGEADVEAHDHGTGPGYTAAIERCDSRLGALLAAIDSRPGRTGEGWTVIVVTDHGHVDEGGHGGESEEERTAWIAASGPGLPTAIASLDHADIHAHVLAVFGVTADGIEGVPFGHRQGHAVQPA
ncbi:phosphodiesterase [Arthrobacter sp. SW1]|uniref:alkaline phosphatase family protein n=1 Tax=Arthrobacter sp. SW1 TaxID=1920889 RepID=UPI000877D34B|nr:alkaline phosphatase family protein [Arthrobacter sp. SW1]OFI39376.1 phosphodiesterase [Arthrobacter sp. SW1]